MALTKRPVTFPEFGSVRPNTTVLFGIITITAAGAVVAASSAAAYPDGFSAAKNAAAGRYDITVAWGGFSSLVAHVQMVGPDSAAFPTTTGSDPQVRLLSASAGTFSIQGKRTDTQADADFASGTKLMVTIFVAD